MSWLARARTALVVPLALACALAVTACGEDRPAIETTPTLPADATAPVRPEGTEGPAEAAACSSVQEPPIQQGSHLLGGQDPPGPYSSSPPTSGWHSSGAFEIGTRGDDEPLSEPEQVSVLEAGGVVVTYRDLQDDDRERLERLVREELRGRVAVTPYDRLEPGQVAMTAWGRLQVCEGLDLDAVRAFADTHAAEEPDTPGAH